MAICPRNAAGCARRIGLWRMNNRVTWRIRRAVFSEAAALSDLCVRSKAAWGYDDAFMRLARQSLTVKAAQIVAGDVWVATAEDDAVVGMMSLAACHEPHTIDLNKLFVEPTRLRTGI